MRRHSIVSEPSLSEQRFHSRSSSSKFEPVGPAMLLPIRNWAPCAYTSCCQSWCVGRKRTPPVWWTPGLLCRLLCSTDAKGHLYPCINGVQARTIRPPCNLKPCIVLGTLQRCTRLEKLELPDRPGAICTSRFSLCHIPSPRKINNGILRSAKYRSPAQ